MGSPTIVVTTNNQETACESKPGDSIVDRIFHQLTDKEKEQAARASSYKYLVASTSSGASPDDRDQHARSTIQRYITVEQKLGKNKSPDEWMEAAYTKLIKTLEYREEKKVDAIRLCFDKDKVSENDDELHATIRDNLEKRYANKASIIRGYTKDGRAMFQNIPRGDTSWEEEYYIKGNIYMMERALACTERKTNGKLTKVVVFYDYNGYATKNSPPPLLIKQLMSDFRDHWPEQLMHSFIVDSPFIFRAFWAIIKHFIDPITRAQVQFITGEEQKQLFREMIDEDQAAPYMYEGGKDGEEADFKAFFYDVPFDHAYGEDLRT